MFDTLDEAVEAFRAAGAENRRAHAQRDYVEMRAASDRIRAVSAFLRSRGRADLIQPLTMEWVTRGRDHEEHERHRKEVERLLRG
ncbi:hypothetical protein [Pseudonocardia sp. TRM90224]|uniref:hypothetical protein n=1 Tax=Pseudonocardia sp. TRM90224 TaxID=2812678 RepID=UPI001E3AF024|nr:hypothetical protein [Pseudonocardia sp. TRM90224]